MSIHNVDFERPQCMICHKRLAVSLCDFPLFDSVAYIHRVGGLSIEHHHGTCDLKLCEVCRVHINDQFDLCPNHTKEVKQAIGGIQP